MNPKSAFYFAPATNYESLYLKCGADIGPLKREARYFQIRFQNDPVQASKVSDLMLNNQSIMDRLSYYGCFKVDRGESGSLVAIHGDRRHAEIIDLSSTPASVGVHDIVLRPFTPVGENIDLQRTVFKEFCPSSDYRVYVAARLHAFYIGRFKNVETAGLQVKLIQVGKTVVPPSNTIVEQSDRLASQLVAIELKHEDIHQTSDPFRLQLEVSDYLGSKFITPVCTIIVDSRVPTVNAIGGATYFPGMYVEVEKKSNLEFNLVSHSPILSARLMFYESGSDQLMRKDIYVPFSVKDQQWSLIAPLPKLSGPKDVVIELENASGLIQRYFFTTDFGLRFHLESKVKKVSKSRNQRFITYFAQNGEIRIVDSKNSKVIFETVLPYVVGNAKTDNNGQKLVISSINHIHVIDLQKKIENTYGESTDRFEILSATNQIVLVAESSKIKWIETETGKVEKTVAITGEIIRDLIVSDDESFVFVATDKRSIHSIRNNRESVPDLIEKCPFGTINVMDYSHETSGLTYNCNEVIFHKNISSQIPAEEIFRFRAGDGARSIAFAARNAKVLVGSDLGEWYVIDLSGRSRFPQNRLEGLEEELFFNASVVSIVVSGDGQTAIVGSDDGEAKIFSVSNQQLGKRISLDAQILDMGFSPDSSNFFIASPESGLIFYRVWNESASLNIGQRIRNLAVSGNGLLTASTITETSSASSSNAAALVVDVDRFIEVRRIEHARTVNYVDISKDGLWVLSASDDWSARLTDLESGLQENLIEKWNSGNRAIRKAIFSQDNKRIAVIFHTSVLVFDRENLDKPIYSFTANDWIPHAEFATNDRYLVVASADKTARIIDLSTLNIVAEVTTQNWVWHASLSPDGNYFSVLSWDNSLRIFETKKNSGGEVIGLKDYFAVDLSTTGEHMTFSPDGRSLAVSLWSGEVLLVSLAEKRVLKLLCSQKGFASPPSFSPNNQLLAVGHNNMAYLYRVKDGKPVMVVNHGDRVSSLAFFGEYLISAGSDSILKKTILDLSSKASCQ